MVGPQTSSLNTSIVDFSFFGSADLPWHPERSQWGTLTTSSNECTSYFARSHARLVLCARCMLHDVDELDFPHTVDTTISNFLHKIRPRLTGLHTQGTGNSILCFSLSREMPRRFRSQLYHGYFDGSQASLCVLMRSTCVFDFI